MRHPKLALAIALAASAAWIFPALAAKNSSPNSHANANAQTSDEAPEATGCRAYQQGADGSWIQLPCREGGASQPPARGKSANHTTSETAR